MKLYYSPGACSMASHIVLNELGGKFDADKVDFASRKTASGEDFNVVNPKGAVPAIRMDDGQVLTEGAVILQYLCDQAGNTSLMPKAGSMERYRQNEWLNWVAADLHKAYSPLFNADIAAKAGEHVMTNIHRRLAHLDKHLASHEYLMGKTFSAADAYCFNILSWSGHRKVDLSKYKNIEAYQARIAARPSVQNTLKAEGLAA